MHSDDAIVTLAAGVPTANAWDRGQLKLVFKSARSEYACIHNDAAVTRAAAVPTANAWDRGQLSRSLDLDWRVP